MGGFNAVRIIAELILSQKRLCLQGCVESTAFYKITALEQIPNYVCLQMTPGFCLSFSVLFQLFSLMMNASANLKEPSTLDDSWSVV